MRTFCSWSLLVRFVPSIPEKKYFLPGIPEKSDFSGMPGRNFSGMPTIVLGGKAPVLGAARPLHAAFKGVRAKDLAVKRPCSTLSEGSDTQHHRGAHHSVAGDTASQNAFLNRSACAGHSWPDAGRCRRLFGRRCAPPKVTRIRPPCHPKITRVLLPAGLSGRAHCSLFVALLLTEH